MGRAQGIHFVIGVALPTCFIGGYYLQAFFRCRTWREELINNDRQTHRDFNATDSMFLRRVLQTTDATSDAKPDIKNPGLRTSPDFLTDAENDMLLSEIKAMLPKYGTRLGEKRRQQLELLGATPRDIESIRIISDRVDDFDLMTLAPWGCGDSLKEERIPPVLRHLIRRIRATHQNCGRVRHISVEFTSAGCQYKVPSAPNRFDGMEYCMFSLGGDRVLTFSPRQQSLRTGPQVAKLSWTDFDTDVFLPRRNMVQVANGARHQHLMGARPGTTQSFGGSHSAENIVPMPKEHALLQIHFEGPVADGKVRSKFKRPEWIAFGREPTQEDFAPWDANEKPTEEDMRGTGLLNFFFFKWLLFGARDKNMAQTGSAI